MIQTNKITQKSGSLMGAVFAMYLTNVKLYVKGFFQPIDFSS